MEFHYVNNHSSYHVRLLQPCKLANTLHRNPVTAFSQPYKVVAGLLQPQNFHMGTLLPPTCPHATLFKVCS